MIDRPDPQPEPDLTDPKCGTDDDLLRRVRDIWKTPGGEEK